MYVLTLLGDVRASTVESNANINNLPGVFGFPIENVMTTNGGNRYATKVNSAYDNGITADNSCFNYDVDMIGPNLFELESVSSWQDCKSLCEMYKSCDTWSFDYRKLRCYGKQGGERKYVNGYISGALECLISDCPLFYDQDLPGYDTFNVHVESIMECVKVCREKDDCNAFAYWRQNCFFKNIEGPVMPTDNYGVVVWRECAQPQCGYIYNIRPLGNIVNSVSLTNPSLCKEACYNNSQCVCWSYGFEMCTLHSTESCNKVYWKSTGSYVSGLKCDDDNNGRREWGSLGLYSRYGLVSDFRGADFIDDNQFEYVSIDDPTTGYVNYVDLSLALSQGLVSVEGPDRVIIRADSENVSSGRGRNSIRIESRKSWDEGLFVWAIRHQPYGCGTWPALWTVGENWPEGSEIDVLEGANLQKRNHIALHTSKNCHQRDNKENFDGTWKLYRGKHPVEESTDCYAYSNPHNTGCSIESNQPSYGTYLNNAGESYYVMEFKSSSHVKVWYFTNADLPIDIINGAPIPENWTKEPQAHFKLGANCDGRSHFSRQRLILNTTFCGGYAGNSFLNDGCPNSGVGSQLDQCVDYVKNNPSAFREAYWDIKYIRIYQYDKGVKNVHSSKEF